MLAWNVVWSQLRQAAADLGIDEQRAAVVLALWKTCPDCVAQDANGATNYYVIRAALSDIDAGRDVACSCKPYVTTRDQYELCQAFYQSQPPPAGTPPCGYGWLLRDAQGQPIFYEPSPAPLPQPGGGGTASETAPSRGGGALLGFGIFAGLVFGTAYVVTATEGKATRRAGAY